MVERKAWQCDCGKNYFTKQGAKNHEKVCVCWTNPKYKTCLTCKFYRVFTDSNGMEHEPYNLETWKQVKYTNPLFKDYMFHAVHKNAPDINMNCPVWENKKP